jgi:hypothetical protein
MYESGIMQLSFFPNNAYLFFAIKSYAKSRIGFGMNFNKRNNFGQPDSRLAI